MLGCIPCGIKFGRKGPVAPGGGMGCKINISMEFMTPIIPC